MRIAAVSLLAVATLTGCMTLHAQIPEDVVRLHAASEHGVDVGASCANEGKHYSEGALACMAGQRMTCDPSGRWSPSGDC